MQPPGPAHRRLVITLLAIYVVLAALVAFWPTPVDGAIGPKLARLIEKAHNHGMPTWIGYDQVQFGANILFFIPLTLLLTVLVGRHFWALVALIGLAASVAIEFVQAEFLAGRFSSIGDVAANAIGSLIGALIARRLLGKKRTMSGRQA